MAEYPGSDTIPAQVATLQKAGYIPVASLILPETCWTDYFYAPQDKAQEAFLAKYTGNEAVADLMANQRHETEHYMKYKSFYGDTSYIGRKL